VAACIGASEAVAQRRHVSEVGSHRRHGALRFAIPRPSLPLRHSAVGVSRPALLARCSRSDARSVRIVHNPFDVVAPRALENPIGRLVARARQAGEKFERSLAPFARRGIGRVSRPVAIQDHAMPRPACFQCALSRQISEGACATPLRIDRTYMACPKT